LKIYWKVVNRSHTKIYLKIF